MTIEELQAQIDEMKASNEALAGKNRELLGEVKAAKAKAKGADIDPEAHAGLQHEVETLKADMDKALKAHAKEVEKLTGQLSKKDSALQSHLIDNGLGEAMLKAGVKPELMPAVKAMLKQQATLKEDGDDFTALMGDKPLAEAVLEWAGSDEGKAFVTAPDNSGGGAAGGDVPAGGSGGAKGDLGGDKVARMAAINARFPELSQAG